MRVLNRALIALMVGSLGLIIGAAGAERACNKYLFVPYDLPGELFGCFSSFFFGAITGAFVGLIIGVVLPVFWTKYQEKIKAHKVER